MKELNEVILLSKRFIEDRYSDCLCGLLGGSYIEGRAHERSDIDIVVITAGDEHYAVQDSIDGVDIDAQIIGIKSYPQMISYWTRNAIPGAIRIIKEGVTTHPLRKKQYKALDNIDL